MPFLQKMKARLTERAGIASLRQAQGKLPRCYNKLPSKRGNGDAIKNHSWYPNKSFLETSLVDRFLFFMKQP